MDIADNLSPRASALEKENHKLLQRLESLKKIKLEAENENFQLQKTLEELQIQLLRTLGNRQDSTRTRSTKFGPSGNQRYDSLKKSTNAESLPQLNTPSHSSSLNASQTKPCVDEILQMKFPDVFPFEDNLRNRSSSSGKQFAKHAFGPQSSNVEKILRQHEKLVQGSVSHALSAVKSDQHWSRRRAIHDPPSSTSEYDLDGRILNKSSSADDEFCAHSSISNLVHLQQQKVLASKLEEISRHNKSKVEGLASKIEGSYPKRGQVVQRIAERANDEGSCQNAAHASIECE